MLYLNEYDIRRAITMEDTIDAIDAAYKIYDAKQFQMPTRMQIANNENTLIVMPCMTTSAIATKLVTSFPNNKKHPTLHGSVILNSSKTGEILAILDGSFITGIRTGAIGGSAIRHLAKSNIRKIAIIGTGVQGLYQAIAACTVHPITDIFLYNRTYEKIDTLIDSFKEWIDYPVALHKTESVVEAIQDAEIIITTTTSHTPVLPNDASLLQGKLIIGIGSFQPNMREFPRELYDTTDHIFIDSHDAINESGDLKTPLDHNWISKNNIHEISTHIVHSSTITHKPDKSIVFKSTGMALFDTVVANVIYQKAIEKGVGIQLI
ncbi:ornithine cyclodeaminase family protein [Oceanobacillus bengalensis]|uniref:Ornithine cyclodeaminase family protein n=1 Tax=Oceanobacillus bengalensis TaxID=1435466 RepID=A0A494YWL2_9BACI|nr:ornithine cyclodeaminase family protein [Oceanobacillus bengalensis]RKQ14618.1 ornithine cyclodeaminase family protein [Oceanobacillus bengalensis]